MLTFTGAEEWDVEFVRLGFGESNNGVDESIFALKVSPEVISFVMLLRRTSRMSSFDCRVSTKMSHYDALHLNLQRHQL